MAVKYGGTGKLTDRIANALRQASGDRWKVTLEQDFVYVAKRQSHARHDRVAVDGYHRTNDEIVHLFLERWTRATPAQLDPVPHGFTRQNTAGRVLRTADDD